MKMLKSIIVKIPTVRFGNMKAKGWQVTEHFAATRPLLIDGSFSTFGWRLTHVPTGHAMPPAFVGGLEKIEDVRSWAEKLEPLADWDASLKAIEAAAPSIREALNADTTNP